MFLGALTMRYAQFSLWFTNLHLVLDLLAGAIDLQLAKRFYCGKR